MANNGWPNPPQATENGNAATAIIPLIGEIVGNPTPAPRASNRLRLSTIADCKREIRRCYVAARNGEIPLADAGKLVWMLSTLANLIADHELEARISELERK